MSFDHSAWTVRLLFCLAAFLLMAALPLQAEETTPPSIELATHSLTWNSKDPADLSAGEMRFAGGIEISSSDSRFGGWSGLAVSQDGDTLVAISDTGLWLTARMLYDEKGRLSGLVQGVIAPMLDQKGKPLEGKMLGDAESLVIDGDDITRGMAYVSFERAHRIWRYDLSKNGFASLPDQLLTQNNFGRLAANGGIESLELLPPKKKGGDPRLLAITEDTLDPRGNIMAFIANGRKLTRFSLRPNGPYKPTDVARLPYGDLLVLERRFSPLSGVGMSLRLLKGASLKEGAVLSGTLLADFSQLYAIDNMEGMALRRDDEGTLWLYVISDDNFNPLQRSLLLMFRLDPKKLKPRQIPATVE
ncbi:MAG: twin-arginine translocation pathway signal [Rhizobiales bacterium]|nr:twin-arginine translocation pathway signal [Hyphomicrobiales bacterium]